MIVAAADGSSLKNPGPAGWAWYVDDDRWGAGGWAHGTNNMGELMAVIDLLRQTAPVADEPLRVLCDSQYVINAATSWMKGWKRRGWRKADGKPVLNVDLLKELDAELDGRDVTFEWVKGHAGHELNEAADERARAAATAFRDQTPVETGPGFGAGTVTTRQPDPTPTWSEQDSLFGAGDTDQPDPTDEDVVVALEWETLSPQVRSDPERFAALLHPDFVEHGTSGRVWRRPEVLDELGSLDEPPSVQLLGVENIAPDVLLVRWIGHSGDTRVQRASLWVRERGSWRMRFHQGTLLPD